MASSSSDTTRVHARHDHSTNWRSVASDGSLTGLFGERFSVHREIVRGGIATVYLAQDHKHDPLVAIKVLRPELAATVSAERFLRGIRTIARLGCRYRQPYRILSDEDPTIRSTFTAVIQSFTVQTRLQT